MERSIYTDSLSYVFYFSSYHLIASPTIIDLLCFLCRSFWVFSSWLIGGATPAVAGSISPGFYVFLFLLIIEDLFPGLSELNFYSLHSSSSWFWRCVDPAAMDKELASQERLVRCSCCFTLILNLNGRSLLLFYS